MLRRKVLLIGAVVATGIIAAMAIAFGYITTRNPEFRISELSPNNELVINCSDIVFSYKQLKINVPLRKLRLKKGEVKEIISTCRCTGGEVGDEDDFIQIKYDPSRSKVEFHESISVIPHDRTKKPRIIHLKGKIIPGWYARPYKISIERIRPDETKTVQCDVEIKYELPSKVQIADCRLEPSLPRMSIDSKLLNNSHVRITGIIKGVPIKKDYKGKIILGLDIGEKQTILVPVELHFVGYIQASPDAVTLMNTDTEVTVNYEHIDKKRLTISSIESPEYLKVADVGFVEDSYSLKYSAKKELLPDTIKFDDIKVYFDGFKDPAIVRCVIIP
jgi:hypothetical protein